MKYLLAPLGVVLFIVLAGCNRAEKANAPTARNRFPPMDKLAEILQASLGCHRTRWTAPADGFGTLWGCYDEEENLKLWINEKPNTNYKVANIKLMKVVYHGQQEPVEASRWAAVLAERFGGEYQIQINGCFNNGYNQVIDDNFRITLDKHVGPSAEQVTMVIEEIEK